MVELESDKLNNDADEKDNETKKRPPPQRIANKIQTGGEKKKKSNEDMAGVKGDEDNTSREDEIKLTRMRIAYENVCLRIGVNPNLLFLKITLFAMYGATACLIPYLTVHMQSIGLTIEDIGVIYLLLPLTTFLAPPITGYLVDKMGNYKPVVVISLLLNLIFHHSLLWIPDQEMPGVMPAAYVVRHPDTGLVEVWWSPCPSRECPDENELNMILDDCEDYCLLQEDEPAITKKRKLPVGPTNIAVMPPTNIKNSNILPNVYFRPETPKKTQSNKFKVDKNGKAITSNGKPADGSNSTHKSTKEQSLHVLYGKNKTKKTNGRRKEEELPIKEEEDAAIFFIDMHQNLADPIEQLGLEVEQDDNDTFTDFRMRFATELLMRAGVNVTALEEFDLRCGGTVMATNLTYIKLKDLAHDCMLQKCMFIEGGPEICPPDYLESDDNVFWIYFALRFIGTTMLSGCVTILDPIALILIQQFGGEFGRERLFSCIGMAIFSPLTGILIDYFSYPGYTDYRAAFYAYDLLLLVTIGTVLLMPVVPSLPADNILQDTLAIVKMPHVVAFIFFLFLIGNFWGFIESYVFLYLKELGASNYLLGITVTVGTISSMPFLYGADKLTKKFGHINIIVCAFFTHAVRLMGYSFIEEAWWCFPFEALEALAVHLMWIAAATYCARLAPRNLLATLIGILGMAHFSLGRGAGSFVGGELIGTVGTRKSFRIMGIIAVVAGFAYYLLNFFWLRKLKIVKDLEAEAEAEDEEKRRLQSDSAEGDKPTTRDIGISAERLSLMIEFHHRGSLTSLDRSLRSFQRSNLIVKSNMDVNSRRRSTSSLTQKLSTPNLPRHNSLSRDKVFRDNGTSISPVALKKSVDTMYRLEENVVIQVGSSSSERAAILEEDESKRSSKNEMVSIGVGTSD